MSVLQMVLDQTYRRHDFSVGPGGLMNQIYGDRWARHPDNGQVHGYYRLLLESLVDSGDLTMENHAYHLNPRALSTLAQFEEDNRKHRDLVNLQRIIAGLTFALVVVGLIQAYDF